MDPRKKYTLECSMLLFMLHHCLSLCLGTDLVANMLPNHCILGFISLQCSYLSEVYLTLNIKLLFIIIQFF